MDSRAARFSACFSAFDGGRGDGLGVRFGFVVL
jgi:hypothetical protein